MDDIKRDRVRHALNSEVVQRMLVKYFIDKGVKSFDQAINPITIQDLPFLNVGLDTKIDIEPHAVEVDPTTGRAALGWNLYVLGNQRIYLGETHHDNLLDLARQIQQGQINPESTISMRRCTTPRRIIVFIIRVLNSHHNGYVDITARNKPVMSTPRAYRPIGQGQESQWYQRSGYNA